MGKKLKGKALENLEAARDVGSEVLASLQEIKAGGGRRTKVGVKSQVAQARLKSGPSQVRPRRYDQLPCEKHNP